jgi:hypothetical protein
MPIPPIRSVCFIAALLFASGQCIATPRVEPERNLSLDNQLRAYDSTAPLPLVQFDQIQDDRTLRLSPAIPPAESRPVGPLGPSLRDRVESALLALWILSAILLGLHIIHEWIRVMRIRIRRPARSIAMEHAPWPTISILIPARGSVAEQSQQLDALHSCHFDYPADRIHFVPMFDPADRSLISAVSRLTQAFPDRVHPLPMMGGRNTTLAAALHAAVGHSVGSALVVLDQNTPLSKAWLRQSITPLFDPAVGSVLTRAIPTQTESALGARLDLLGDQADTLIASQSDALSLLLCGKARIRSLRRHMGWQSQLLGEVQHCTTYDSPDLIRSPRMRLSIAWRSMRMASLLLNPNIPLGARLQGGAAFFSAALPLIWLASLASGIALYFIGAPLAAGLAIALCAATSFDPHGQPSPAFSIAAGARMAGTRTEIRLLPLSSFSFLDRMMSGLRSLLRATRENAASATTGHPASRGEEAA